MKPDAININEIHCEIIMKIIKAKKFTSLHDMWTEIKKGNVSKSAHYLVYNSGVNEAFMKFVAESI